MPGEIRGGSALRDVGFDGHDDRVWSLEEILARLRPRLAAFEELKKGAGSSTRSAVEASGSRSRHTRPRRWGLTGRSDRATAPSVRGPPARRSSSLFRETGRFLGRLLQDEHDHDRRGTLCKRRAASQADQKRRGYGRLKARLARMNASMLAATAGRRTAYRRRRPARPRAMPLVVARARARTMNGMMASRACHMLTVHRLGKGARSFTGRGMSRIYARQVSFDRSVSDSRDGFRDQATRHVGFLMVSRGKVNRLVSGRRGKSRDSPPNVSRTDMRFCLKNTRHRDILQVLRKSRVGRRDLVA